MQPKLFQVPHTVFAFRGVLHDPLRELRPDALKLLLRVHLDTLRTQFFPSAIKSARQIVQRTWPESKLTFSIASLFTATTSGEKGTKLSREDRVNASERFFVARPAQ